MTFVLSLCITIIDKHRSFHENVKIFLRSYADSKELCTNLGGEMLMDWRTFPKIDYTLGDPNADQSKSFWLPIVLGNYTTTGDYHWVNDLPSAKSRPIKEEELLKWDNSQPNAIGFQKCLDVWQYNNDSIIGDSHCDAKYWSVCSMPMAQIFYLRGLGLESAIDQKYSLSLEMGWNNTKVTFEGQGASQVVWHPSLKKTEIVHKGKAILDFEGKPFGSLFMGSGRTLKHLIFTNVRLRFKIIHFHNTVLN